MSNLCSIDGCTGRVHGRGWCGKHYQRWQNTGTPLGHPVPTVEERFWAKVDAFGDCWVWTAGRTGGGYGRFNSGQDARRQDAHRWSWEHLVGPIPQGFQIDHLCKNRACVNPDHLEPVLPVTNVLRSGSFAAHNSRKTRCPQGHPYSGSNLYQAPGNRRHCRACGRSQAAAILSRRKASAR